MTLSIIAVAFFASFAGFLALFAVKSFSPHRQEVARDFEFRFRANA